MRSPFQRIARLLDMSRDEVRSRGAQAAMQRWDAIRGRLGGSAAPAMRRGLARQADFFFSPANVADLVDVLGDRLPAETASIVARADRLCEGRFDLLGYENISFDGEIDWHLDPVSGRRAPRRAWHKVPFLDFGRVGDAKVTWELNRHQHWVTLAKAYRITGNDRYAAQIATQWIDWWESNPYPFGINWASALEVAFRSLSWIWVKHLLEGTPALTDSLAEGMVGGLALSGRHIETYLSTYFSPNTHLLGEAVALFFIGTLVPEAEAAERWQSTGWRIVLEEADNQVLADGMHFEQSAYYHVYALDFFLHSRILAARNGIEVPAAMDRSLQRQLDVLSWLGRSGTVFLFGDDDGGRLFDGQRNRPECLLDPLATGAALLGRGDLKAAAGGLREETVWLLGEAGVQRFDELRARPAESRSRGFETGGLYFFGNTPPSPASALINAGPFGRPSGGHGHAGLLALQVALHDRLVLGDSGTFVYVDTEGSRDRFRRSSAHNTLQVDGRSQAEPRGPFSWKTLPGAEVDIWSVGPGFDLFRGHHGAYAEAGAPLTHTRWLFNLGSGLMLVRDAVEGDGRHRLDLFWNLAPGVVLHPAGDAAHFASIGDEPALAIVTETGNDWRTSVYQEFSSPVYGRREPHTVLRFSTDAALPHDFVTLLRPSTGPAPEIGALRRLVDETPGGVAGFEYATDESTHLFFFSSRAGAWRLLDWESDASFLYCRMDGERRRWSEAMVVGGGVVRRGAQTHEAPSSVDSWTWQDPES